MQFFTRIWTTVVTITQWISLTPFDPYNEQQQALGVYPHSMSEILNVKHSPPIFTPPGSNINGFQCNYDAMGPDWYNCSSIPGCWLANKNGQDFFNITTDYESLAPVGIMRSYTLYLSNKTVNADGLNFTEAKVFNQSFPGPLIEACWGDTLNITVVNDLPYNGTSVHWHGIRQGNTMHMDGVNGITQCPIAPGDSFTYQFNVTQYGSSWYHSHYSVQYADGAQGPITLHGPTTAYYDEAITPLLTSDWLHNSAFNAQTTGKQDNVTILLDGKGNYTMVYDKPADEQPPQPFNMTFGRISNNPGNGARRYLVRVINTSYATQITFSIDNHYLQIVEADFVPVIPTTNLTSVLVAIGQRYHLIVEAQPYEATGTPVTNPIPQDQNFWIRTQGSGCGDDLDKRNNVVTGWERTGILRYEDAPINPYPSSQPWPGMPKNCDDTISANLTPAFQWNVTKAINGGEIFTVKFQGNGEPYELAKFSLQAENSSAFIPFQTSYDNPTFLNLDNLDGNWPMGWVVIPENYTDTDFVYLILQGQGHPIHLHGHDFAVLDYKVNTTFERSSLQSLYINPGRRDVILLPQGGYAVIAFKTDNPGAWLMHCHIALHASSGLSLQIMERQSAANQIWQPGNSAALTEAHRVCANWNTWAYNCTNYWPGLQDGTYPACLDDANIQNDSGV